MTLEPNLSISHQNGEKNSVMPRITSEISEFDTAVLVGCNEEQYVILKRGMTAVTKGVDFIYSKNRYQNKANRPSGKSGSKVILVSRAKNYDWDLLILIFMINILPSKKRGNLIAKHTRIFLMEKKDFPQIICVNGND